MRWRLSCDVCDAGGWIGARGHSYDAWCESCQSQVTLPGAEPAGTVPCPACGASLTTGPPRFEELLGQLQHLEAVLAAWDGIPAPLSTILPDRPRWLTDLTPPAGEPGDPPEMREGLAALARGGFRVAVSGLEAATGIPMPGARAARLQCALGIAYQRLGDRIGAEHCFGAALALEPEDRVARLDRGALRAGRGDFEGAREDFARAGEEREARWDRAALRVLEAVATTPGLPAPARLEEARREVEPQSDYWSDHTVGRLLWTALIERALARRNAPGVPRADERVLRVAALQLEFDTFWDRALIIHGFAATGMATDCAAVAGPLALELIQALRAEPSVRGPAGRPIDPPLARAETAIRERRARPAREALALLLEREDLRHYRVPCLRCGRGSLGLEEVAEEAVP